MKNKTKRKTREEKLEEARALLPATLSNIQVQKKNSTRYSLFANEQFLIGISESTYSKFNLEKGQLISPSLFEEIVTAENKWAVRDYIFRILARRDHSRKELKDKAYKKGYSGTYVAEILDEFTQKGYIDDSKFARQFAAEKFELNHWGPYKIRAHLLKKGIQKTEAEQALQQVFGDNELLESMITLIRKKRKRYLREPKNKRKKKIFDFLMRKGYDSEYILKYMDELLAIVSS